MELETVKDSRRDDEVRVKVTKGQKETIKKLADGYGMTISDFIRYCITEIGNRGY